MADAQSTPASGSAAARPAGARQQPEPRPYGNPQPADWKDMPTVEEIHSRLPKDVPGGAPEGHEEAFVDAVKEGQLHPRHLAGLHRESVGGPLVADDKNDPGINLNVIS